MIGNYVANPYPIARVGWRTLQTNSWAATQLAGMSLSQAIEASALGVYRPFLHTESLRGLGDGSDPTIDPDTGISWSDEGYGPPGTTYMDIVNQALQAVETANVPQAPGPAPAPAGTNWNLWLQQNAKWIALGLVGFVFAQNIGGKRR
jgi:hypothetical protein